MPKISKKNDRENIRTNSILFIFNISKTNFYLGHSRRISKRWRIYKRFIKEIRKKRANYKNRQKFKRN